MGLERDAVFRRLVDSPQARRLVVELECGRLDEASFESAFAGILGVPPEDAGLMIELSNELAAATDPDHVPDSVRYPTTVEPSPDTPFTYVPPPASPGIGPRPWKLAVTARAVGAGPTITMAAASTSAATIALYRIRIAPQTSRRARAEYRRQKTSGQHPNVRPDIRHDGDAQPTSSLRRGLPRRPVADRATTRIR